MKRINSGFGKHWLLLVLCLFSSFTLMAQVKFDVTGNGTLYEGCMPHSITFEVTNVATGDVVEAIVDSFNKVDDSKWQKSGSTYKFTWVFQDAGTYRPKLRVKSTGGGWQPYYLGSPIVVYSLPKVDYELSSDTGQCFKGNEFCFVSKATPGDEGNKIVTHSWNFGDGGVSKKANVCYSYTVTDNFDIYYAVVDEKGCQNSITRLDHPETYKNIGTAFDVRGPVGCPCTDIFFNNKTKFDTSRIDFWVWDWGTGSRKAKDTFYMTSPGNVDYNDYWSDFTRQYCNDGFSSPKLLIVATNGCRDSVRLKDAIRVVNFKFDITWTPDVPCFAGNEIRFNMPPRPNYSRLLWIFGDPASMNLNVNQATFSPSHSFVGGAGFYNVTFGVEEPPCPFRDTTICFVKLKGPAASINLPNPPFAEGNKCADPREIKPSEFERIKYDACYRNSSGVTSLQYVTADFRKKSKKDSLFMYCNADTVSFLLDSAAAGDGAVSCQRQYYITTEAGFIEKNLFQTRGVAHWVNKGDSVIYDNQRLVATQDEMLLIKCDKFYFEKGDSVPRHQGTLDSFPIYAAPDPGVNGDWRYRYNKYEQTFFPMWNSTDAIPVRDSLQITDTAIFVATGAKVLTTFWIYAPYIRVHEVDINGFAYIYRLGTSPIKHKGGLYFPPMHPGTVAPNCEDEWRQMHDSDKFKFDCKAPNLVSFTNNTKKYRSFDRDLNDVPFHNAYSLNNLSAAWLENDYGMVADSCADNTNGTWASDSLEYTWDFGDNSDQCTTYYDANKTIRVKGDNPTGDPLQCKYSEIVTPQHLYVDDGCWTAILSVYDPVTECTSTATQPIVMEEPDGGPADPKGALKPGDVTYYNQMRIREDENSDDFRTGVQVGQGDPPCVGNATNPYFQRLDISQTIPRCGRETFWIVFNRGNHNDEDTFDLDDDSECEMKYCVTKGNGKIVKRNIKSRGSSQPKGVHDVVWRVVLGPNQWGKIEATGKATINALQFLDNVTVENQRGIIPSKGKVQMLFKSTGTPTLNPNGGDVIVYGKEEINSSYYECNWLDEMTIGLMQYQKSYSVAGCKTPGIVIKVGDCFDTFFYENYRYLLDANSEFLLSPNPRTHLIEEDEEYRGGPDLVRKEIVDEVEFVTCKEEDNDSLLPTKLPYPMIISIRDYLRNDPLGPDEDPVCDASDSIRKFSIFFTKSADQCGRDNKFLSRDSLLNLNNGYDPIKDGDTNLINLRDTLHFKLLEAGKYVITSTANAKHGLDFCSGSSIKEIWVGQLQCFRFDDSVLCEGQTVNFYDSTFYWHKGGQAKCDLDGSSSWNTTCADTALFFYNPEGNSSRKDWLTRFGNFYKLPEYHEMIAWDFNSSRWKYENGDTTRMEDWMRVMDSTDIETWVDPLDPSYTFLNPWAEDPLGDDFLTRTTQWTYGESPEFGIGKYDVTLWARDSMGCWMPYTKQNAITVVGVDARFDLCPTCNDTLVCAPQQVEFFDKSVILENKDDVPSGESLEIGLLDKIISWRYTFGDNSTPSPLQNPVNVYYSVKEDGYDVELVVTTEQGCIDTITKPQFIKIIGPDAKFDITEDTICLGDTIYALDQTVSKTKIDEYVWSLGDGSSTNSQDGDNKIPLVYTAAGEYEISLFIKTDVIDPITGATVSCDDEYPDTDPNGANEAAIKVFVRDVDPLVFNLSKRKICPGGEVVFTLNEDSTYENYQSLVWTIDDSVITKARAEELRFQFNELGKHQIKLTGTGPQPLCPILVDSVILVKEVKADIEINEALSNMDLGNYVFSNNSQNGVYFRWRIFEMSDTLNPIDEIVMQSNDTSALEYTKFKFGKYKIELFVADYQDPDDAKACTDVDFVYVNVEPVLVAYNIFSPDESGLNDWWKMEMQAVTDYELYIYDRWGKKVLDADKSDNPTCYTNASTGTRVCEMWNGKINNTAGDATAGTYFYVFKYKFKGDTEFKDISGTITLVR